MKEEYSLKMLSET